MKFASPESTKPAFTVERRLALYDNRIRGSHDWHRVKQPMTAD